MKPYGCQTRPPLGSVPIPAQDGWYTDGHTRTPRLVPLPFRMAKTCQYSREEANRSDPRCAGCKHQIKNEEGTHGTTS